MTENTTEIRHRNGRNAAQTPDDVWDANADLAVVGRPRTRVEGPEKVTGRARYAYDMRLPRQLYAHVLRSPLPHARIRRIDTSRAAALPGVKAAISAQGSAAIPWYKDSYVFDRTVRFVGDEVAAVAAESEEIAEDALRLIDVDYEPLPFVVDLVEALAPDAPKLRQTGNVAEEPDIYQRGDVDAGFAAADVTIDQQYTTQAALHNAMEPHGCTALWEGGALTAEGGTLTIWSSTQSVFNVRERVAQSLGLPEDRVRVIMEYMGGGFGAKGPAWKSDVIASLLSRQTGRPVQLMLDREAENLAAGNRNPTRQRVRLGATRDGRLTAIDARLEQQIGAYMLGGEGVDVSGFYQTMYRCANVRTEKRQIYTNTGPSSSFRAPGYVEAAFAMESAMDELARKLNIDPLELRLRNYTDRDQVAEKPYTTDGLRGCYDHASRAFGWQGARHPDRQAGARRRGIGMAANIWRGGGGFAPAYAWVTLNGDGSAAVITSTQDIGTGIRTGLAQVAAEELGLRPDRVVVQIGDTQRGPYAPPSWGSATQASMGPAVKQAAADVRRQLLDVAARLLNLDAAQMRVRDGVIWSVHSPAHIAVDEVCRQIAPVMLQAMGSRPPNPADRSVKTFGAQFAEVEVDIDTGEVRVVRLATSNDCGRVLNPTLVESQAVGGVIQGTGFALTEERVVDRRTGVVLNANLEEYKVPTVRDAPHVDHALLDLPDPEANATGAKGIGEPPLVATAPAIANAVFDAAGVRIRDLPLTRARILEALEAQRRAAAE